MSVSVLSSLIMLDRCRIYSKNQDTEVSISQPDDQVDLYIDFLEEINPSDWGNDMWLLDLIDDVFNRKEGSD